jgi:hypothetical protein
MPYPLFLRSPRNVTVLVFVLGVIMKANPARPVGMYLVEGEIVRPTDW